MKKHLHFAPRAREAGFTLVEMMVAVTIGLVVVFGMTATFVSLKNTFRSQDKLGQLQDNERLALTFLTSSVNEAGFYPNPINGSPLVGSTAPSTSPASPGGTMPDTTGIFGTGDGTSVATESLQTSYASVSGDGLISCIGSSYAGAGTAIVRNIYYVDSTTNSLMCKVVVVIGGTVTSNAMDNGGAGQVLVSGVTKMAVMYGIASTDSQVAVYQNATNVGTTSANWLTVKAVRITLNFANPFGGADLQRTQTINLMN